MTRRSPLVGPDKPIKTNLKALCKVEYHFAGSKGMLRHFRQGPCTAKLGESQWIKLPNLWVAQILQKMWMVKTAPLTLSLLILVLINTLEAVRENRPTIQNLGRRKILMNLSLWILQTSVRKIPTLTVSFTDRKEQIMLLMLVTFGFLFIAVFRFSPGILGGALHQIINHFNSINWNMFDEVNAYIWWIFIILSKIFLINHTFAIQNTQRLPCRFREARAAVTLTI